jgi:hypothetical protein
MSLEDHRGFRFSKPLEDRLITYFKKYYDLVVSPEDAQLFLRSLGTVYDALSKANKLEKANIE